MNFLEKLQVLRELQPHPCILNMNSENSDYCPYTSSNRNCYLLYGFGHNEDCFYGYWFSRNQDCCDCSYMFECELCCECVSCDHSYNLNRCQDCIDCRDSTFLYDCIGCHDCFGCVGLRQKTYHFFNEKLSPEAYQTKLAEWKNKPHAEIEAKWEKLKLKIPRLYSHQKHNEHSVGDYLYDSRNCFACYDTHEAEDCRYLYNAHLMKDCQDCCFCGVQENELNYEVMSGIGIHGCQFCNVCWYSQNLEYCEYVFNSHDCFGCVSLNHAEYCILNHPYPKDEYFRRITQIKEEMQVQGIYGQHLPSIYNEFLALEQ